jgi:hypothetical protein
MADRGNNIRLPAIQMLMSLYRVFHQNVKMITECTMDIGKLI